MCVCVCVSAGRGGGGRDSTKAGWPVLTHGVMCAWACVHMCLIYPGQISVSLQLDSAIMEKAFRFARLCVKDVRLRRIALSLISVGTKNT